MRRIPPGTVKGCWVPKLENIVKRTAGRPVGSRGKISSIVHPHPLSARSPPQSHEAVGKVKVDRGAFSCRSGAELQEHGSYEMLS